VPPAFYVFSSANSIHPTELYLPNRTNAIRFATVDCSGERNAEHLESLRQLSIRTGQLARAFLGASVLGRVGAVVAATSLDLPDLDTGGSNAEREPKG
jgi:hypothetical protein